MAAKRHKDKRRRKQKRSNVPGRPSGGIPTDMLLDQGRMILLQLVQVEAPAPLVSQVSLALDEATNGNTVMLEEILEMLPETPDLDASGQSQFPFSSAKAVDLLTLAEKADTSSSNEPIDAKRIESMDVSPGLTWIVTAGRPPLWINDQATPRRIWSLYVVDADSEMIVGHAESETAFTKQTIFDELGKIMLRDTSPAKPELLLIEPGTDPELFDDLSPFVKCTVGDDAIGDAMLEISQDLVSQLHQCRPAIDQAENVTEEDVENYYAAVARFYKQSPWRLVQGDRVIGVRNLDAPDQSWGATVIGQMGETLGLSLIEGVDNAVEMIRQKSNISDLNFMCIQFGEDFDMVPSDLLWMERRNRELASVDAYPAFLKLNVEQRDLLLPDRQELQLVTALLNDLPSFLKAGRSGEANLTTAGGGRFSMKFEN